MFELSHEANAAYQVVTGCLNKLNAMTVGPMPKSVDDAVTFSHDLRKLILEVSGAFECFVGGVCTETRKKGLFPTILPQYRNKTMQVYEKGKSFSMDATKLFEFDEEEEGRLKTPQPPGTKSPSKALSTSKAIQSDVSRNTLPSYVSTTGASPVAQNKVGFISTSCNSHNETAEGLVATGAYFLMETLTRETLAKEGMLVVYQPQSGPMTGTEEAQAVVLVGGKPRPPHNVRLPLKTGVIGAVLRTGLAVNIAPEKGTESSPYALCFPIFPVQGKTAPIGAVMLEKKATNTPFTSEDEHATYRATHLLSQLLTQYNVNLAQCTYFDPFRTLLKKTSPAQQYRTMRINKTTELDGLESSIMKGGLYPQRLAHAIAAHPIHQLVFRTVHHNHFTAVRGSLIGGGVTTLQTQNLTDVADYVNNLEECWKRTTDDLQGIEVEQVGRMSDYRERKKQLKAATQRIHQVEELAENYKGKYEALKAELTVICGIPIDEDDTKANHGSPRDDPATGVKRFLSR